MQLILNDCRLTIANTHATTMKRTLLTGCALLFCTASVFSQTQHPRSQKDPASVSAFRSERTPASIKQTEKGGNVLFSFELLSSPDQELLDQSLERFQKIEGFVSLSVNAQNMVEVVTTHSISEKDNSQLLLQTSRLYGYMGYKITA